MNPYFTAALNIHSCLFLCTRGAHIINRDCDHNKFASALLASALYTPDSAAPETWKRRKEKKAFSIIIETCTTISVHNASHEHKRANWRRMAATHWAPNPFIIIEIYVSLVRMRIKAYKKVPVCTRFWSAQNVNEGGVRACAQICDRDSMNFLFQYNIGLALCDLINILYGDWGMIYLSFFIRLQFCLDTISHD